MLNVLATTPIQDNFYTFRIVAQSRKATNSHDHLSYVRACGASQRCSFCLMQQWNRCIKQNEHLC